MERVAEAHVHNRSVIVFIPSKLMACANTIILCLFIKALQYSRSLFWELCSNLVWQAEKNTATILYLNCMIVHFHVYIEFDNVLPPLSCCINGFSMCEFQHEVKPNVLYYNNKAWASLNLQVALPLTNYNSNCICMYILFHALKNVYTTTFRGFQYKI